MSKTTVHYIEYWTPAREADRAIPCSHETKTSGRCPKNSVGSFLERTGNYIVLKFFCEEHTPDVE